MMQEKAAALESGGAGISSSPPTKRTPILRTLGRQKALLFMCIPFVAHVLIFAYLPIWGWLMAFQNYKPWRGILHQKWVGFEHFHRLFADEQFLRVMRNTLAMSVINLVLGFITAIGLALLLNEVKNAVFKRTVQTISYLPHFLSWVVAANIVLTMLASDGPVNALMQWLGWTGKPILFMGIGRDFWGIIGLSSVWKEVGWNTIIYLASISMISPHLYEAADMDGATRLQKMRYVTLPGMQATIVILLILNIGNILNTGFEQPYLLQNAMVKDYSMNLDIFVLEKGVAMSQYSYATAAGIFKSVVSIVLLLAANQLAKRMNQERVF